MVVSRVPEHLTWPKKPGFVGDEKFSTMTGGEEEIKKFQGDGLQLQMDSNHRILEIKGDGCRINLTKNCGSVRVVGDGCSVKINQNVGDIIYTGDGGRVFLGPDSAKGNVKYFGDGGKISFDSNLRRRSKSQSKNRKSPDSIAVTIENKSSHYSSSKDKADSCRNKTKHEEELQNLKNERKEARQSIRRSKNSDDVGKSRETVTVSTKIFTTTEKDDIVRKWFVCPKSIMKFDENTSVTINKTTINKQTKVLRNKIET